MLPGESVGTSEPIGSNSSDGSDVELVGTCVNEGRDMLDSWLGGRVLVDPGDTLGAAVIGKSLASVGNAEIPFGGLLETEVGEVDAGDAVGIGVIEGSAVDTGSNVELPTGTVGAGGALGC